MSANKINLKSQSYSSKKLLFLIEEKVQNEKLIKNKNFNTPCQNSKKTKNLSSDSIKPIQTITKNCNFKAQSQSTSVKSPLKISKPSQSNLISNRSINRSSSTMVFKPNHSKDKILNKKIVQQDIKIQLKTHEKHRFSQDIQNDEKNNNALLQEKLKKVENHKIFYIEDNLRVKNEYNKEILQLESPLNHFHSIIDNLERKLKEQQNQLDNKEKEINDLKLSNEENQYLLSINEGLNSNFSQNNLVLQGKRQKEKFDEENSKKQKYSTPVNQKIKLDFGESVRLNNIKKEKLKLEDLLIEREGKIKDLEEKLKNERKDKNKIIELENKILKNNEINEKYSKELSEKSNRLEILTQKINKLETNKLELLYSIDELKEKKSLENQLQHKISSEIINLKNEKDNLLSQINKANNEIQNTKALIEAKIADFQEKYNKDILEIPGLKKNEIERFSDQEYAYSIESLQNELKQSSLLLENKEEQLKFLTLENKNLTNKNSNLIEEIGKLNERNEKLLNKGKIEYELNNKLLKLEQENINLITEIQELKYVLLNKTENFNKEIDDKKKLIMNFQIEKVELDSRIKLMSEKLQELNEFSKLKSENLMKSDAEVQVLSERINYLEDQIKYYKDHKFFELSENSSTENKISDYINKQDNEDTYLNDQLKKLTERTKALEKNNAELIKLLSLKKFEITELKETNRNLLDTSNKRMFQLEQTIKALTENQANKQILDEINQFRKQADSNEVDKKLINNLIQENDKVKSESISDFDKNQAFKSTLNDLSNENKRLRFMISSSIIFK